MKSRLALLAACCVALGGCSTMSKLWPFHRKAKTGPEAVHELNLVTADGSDASYPQYWRRNALVIDLSGVSGTGSVTARLPEESTWPVRMAVRIRPGSVGVVEVLGEERDVLPVTLEGTDTVDLQFSPSLYTPKTAAIYISWGAVAAIAEAPVAPAAPAFVSPTEVPAGAAPPVDPVPAAPPLPATPPPAGEPPAATEEPGAQSARDVLTPGTEPAPAQPSPGS